MRLRSSAVRSSVRTTVTSVALVTAAAAVALLTSGAPVSARATAPAPEPEPTTTQGTHTLHIHGVALQVPISWHLVHDKYLPGCIVNPASPKPTQGAANFMINNCQLQVLAGPSLRASEARPDSIYLNGPGDPAVCIPNRHTGRVVGFATTRAKDALVGGTAAEYVRFHSRCLVHPLEAWFVAGQPGVLISRSRALVSTEADARQAVASVVLPAGHGLPRGFIGEPLRAGSSTVLLSPSRLFFSGREKESAQRTGAAAVRFHLPAGLGVSYVDRHGYPRKLSRAQFLRDVQHGFPHTGGLHPEVTVTSAVNSDTVRHVQVTLASRH